MLQNKGPCGSRTSHNPGPRLHMPSTMTPNQPHKELNESNGTRPYDLQLAEVGHPLARTYFISPGRLLNSNLASQDKRRAVTTATTAPRRISGCLQDEQKRLWYGDGFSPGHYACDGATDELSCSCCSPWGWEMEFLYSVFLSAGRLYIVGSPHHARHYPFVRTFPTNEGLSVPRPVH